MTKEYIRDMIKFNISCIRSARQSNEPELLEYHGDMLHTYMQAYLAIKIQESNWETSFAIASRQVKST